MENITVVIPVGPDPVYRQWLPECIESVLNQTHKPNHIVFVDDGMKLRRSMELGKNPIPGLMMPAYLYDYPDHPVKIKRNNQFETRWLDHNTLISYTIFEPPHTVGVADAFNFGVALSDNNLVFMLGSDDVMLPTCLEECVKEYEKQKVEGWYSVTIKYMTSGQVQTIACNTAMVSKKLWEDTGGFPPSAGVGAPDALLLSIMMVHFPDRIIHVKEGTPLCLLREHEHQDTKKNAWLFSNEIVSIRNKETTRFVKK